MLRRYAQTMASDFDVTDVLLAFTRELTELLGISGAGILLAGHDGRLVHATASSDEIAALDQVQEEEQEGPCADAFRLRVAVTVVDLDIRAEWVRYRAGTRRLGLRSVLALPLRLGSVCLGVLELYDDVPRTWSDEELGVAGVLGHTAAVLLIHEHLQDTWRRAEELQGALESRVVIEQAKGLLAAERQITIDEAFELLRDLSRRRNITLRALATAVVAGFHPSGN